MSFPSRSHLGIGFARCTEGAICSKILMDDGKLFAVLIAVTQGLAAGAEPFVSGCRGGLPVALSLDGELTGCCTLRYSVSVEEIAQSLLADGGQVPRPAVRS